MTVVSSLTVSCISVHVPRRLWLTGLSPLQFLPSSLVSWGDSAPHRPATDVCDFLILTNLLPYFFLQVTLSFSPAGDIFLRHFFRPDFPPVLFLHLPGALFFFSALTFFFPGDRVFPWPLIFLACSRPFSPPQHPAASDLSDHHIHH